MLLLTGCDDAFGPQPWAFLPDTTDLFSLARAEYIGEPAAYDLISLNPVVVEALRPASPTAPPGAVAATFDMAVTEAEDGSFHLLPAGLFTNFTVTPGLLRDTVGTFEGIAVAPRDGYTVDEPVPAETGVVYIVRSRDSGNGCIRYGKLEVLELREDGVAVIQAIRNPNCNDRDLVPTVEPDEDED